MVCQQQLLLPSHFLRALKLMQRCLEILKHNLCPKLMRPNYSLTYRLISLFLNAFIVALKENQ